MAGSTGPDIIQDGLITYIDVNNKKSYPGSGTTLYDVTSLSFQSTLQNGVEIGNNYFGFDGTNTGIFSSTNSVSYNYSGDLTWSCWLNPNAFQDTWKSVYWGRAGGGTAGFGTGFYKTGEEYRFWFEIYGSTGGRQKKYLRFITPNEWAYYTVVVSYSNLTYTLYKNGIVDSTGALADWTEYNGASSYYIGIYNGSIWAYDGKLSLMSIYKRVLSPQEIQQNYNQTKSRFI